MVSLDAPHSSHKISDYDGFIDLLERFFRKGKLVYPEFFHAIRKFAMQQVKQFLKGHMVQFIQWV